MDNYQHQKERNLFNMAINKENVNVIQTAREIKTHSTFDVLKTDGFHIKELTGKIITDRLNNDNLPEQPKRKVVEVDQTPTHSAPPPRKETSSTIPIPTDAVRYLIDKQGKTTKRIEADYNVKINISDRTRDGSDQTVTLSGKPDNIRNAGRK